MCRSTRVQSFLACFGSRSLVGLKERFGSRAEKPRQFGDGAFDDSLDDATGSATARRRFGNRLTNPGPGFRHDGRPVAAV
jgi:hypothetical protein